MKKVTLIMGLMAGLASSQIYATQMPSGEIDLMGSDLQSATINNLSFKIADFSQASKAGELTQDGFVFERGYDDGYVGPAGYFQSQSIVTCSEPATRITSLADFSAFPQSENPFPTFGLVSYNKADSADKDGIQRIGFRLYKDQSVMNFSGLEPLKQGDKRKTLDAITQQFGTPSMVLKEKDGLRVLYVEKGVDSAALQLAYENALNPQKKDNLLNMTPSTVLYGVLLDASLNSDLPLNIKGNALEFYIGDEYMVFTKYAETGKFIDRVNTELEKCDSTAL